MERLIFLACAGATLIAAPPVVMAATPTAPTLLTSVRNQVGVIHDDVGGPLAYAADADAARLPAYSDASLVAWAVRRAGGPTDLPTDAASIWQYQGAGVRRSAVRAHMRPGDLVFFARGARIERVGVLVRPNRLVIAVPDLVAGPRWARGAPGQVISMRLAGRTPGRCADAASEVPRGWGYLDLARCNRVRLVGWMRLPGVRVGDTDTDTTPYTPPPTLRIAALPDLRTARSLLAARRADLTTPAHDRTDLQWLEQLDRRLAHARAPAGRKAAIARTLQVNAWWYARRRAPAERVIVRDPDGILHNYRGGHGFILNPVATTGRWRGLNAELSATALARALLPYGAVRRQAGVEWAAWEYYDVPADPRRVRPGVSGMAQARIAELMSAAWRESGQARFAHAAHLALGGFAVPVNAGGARALVPDPAGGAPGVWFPERAYPGRDPWYGSALNGFMVTLLSLHATSARLGNSPAAAAARARVDEGVAALVRFLPEHDTGTWSLYGLLTPGKSWKTYVADLNYHCYHILLLEALERALPGNGFGVWQRRWEGYVTARATTCAQRATAPTDASLNHRSAGR